MRFATRREWLKSSALKLSEKGFERRSEHGFGLYIGIKTGRTVWCRCSERLRFWCLQDFSDSFITEFSEVGSWRAKSLITSKNRRTLPRNSSPIHRAVL